MNVKKFTFNLIVFKIVFLVQLIGKSKYSNTLAKNPHTQPPQYSVPLISCVSHTKCLFSHSKLTLKITYTNYKSYVDQFHFIFSSKSFTALNTQGWVR